MGSQKTFFSSLQETCRTYVALLCVASSLNMYWKGKRIIKGISSPSTLITNQAEPDERVVVEMQRLGIGSQININSKSITIHDQKSYWGRVGENEYNLNFGPRKGHDMRQLRIMMYVMKLHDDRRQLQLSDIPNGMLYHKYGMELLSW